APGLQVAADELSLLIQPLTPRRAVRPHRGSDTVRDDQVPVPLRVRRDDDPGRVLRRALADRVLVSLRVVVPALPVFPVLDAQLPGVVRVLLPLQQSFPLLLLRDVEEELEDDAIRLRESALELVDQLVA